MKDRLDYNLVTLKSENFEENKNTNAAMSGKIYKPWEWIRQRVAGLRNKDEEEGRSNQKKSQGNHQSESFDAPNMFLNMNPPKTPQEQWQLRGWAVLSVMIQAAVLVFSGFATYHPRMSYKKDDRQVERYAYFLTAGGTMLVVVGVLLCCLVVEWSTDEKVWKLRDTGRILWLQKGGNFNDQQFGSYAIFAQGTRQTILTSKLSTHKRPEKTGQGRRTSAQAKIGSPSREILVVLATATSVGGFITQFTGLRGMHWSATIAQLIATVIMVVIRAWIRRNLASLPVEYTVPKGHEMDWLATRITKKDHCDRLWRESEREEKLNSAPHRRRLHLFHLAFSTLQRLAKPFTRQSMKDASVSNRSDEVFDEKSPEDDHELFDEKCRDWEIVTGEGVDDFIIHIGPQVENSNGHRIMEMRKRIGSLCNWTGPTSEPAISLAKAIEVVMDSLFPTTAAGDVGVDQVWRWTMNSRSYDGSSSPIELSVKRNEKSGFRWGASATEIEAVLSLWMYSIHTENINIGRGEVGSEEREKSEKSGKEKDWLRDGNAAVRTATLRRLGQGTKPYLRDLRWYLGDKFDVIKEINETNERLVDVVSSRVAVKWRAWLTSCTIQNLQQTHKFKTENERDQSFEGSRLSRETYRKLIFSHQ